MTSQLPAGWSLQDVRILYSQMAGRDVDEPDAPIETSLDQILAYIRSHWEKVTEKNRAETDHYLEQKVRVSHLHRCPYKPDASGVFDGVFPCRRRSV